ncbi:hypothetical protein RRG08_012507 [Elysia crispata]|uniref:Uncharacterized protein n=1 Tax=Elysia crispata TaxID=231223 RepID=A0AAE1AQ69_9GAST|nr:hypothetical protein RRG08_012507 [Elysia crispata]
MRLCQIISSIRADHSAMPEAAVAAYTCVQSPFLMTIRQDITNLVCGSGKCSLGGGVVRSKSQLSSSLMMTAADPTPRCGVLTDVPLYGFAKSPNVS